MIDMQAVWKNEQARADAADRLAGIEKHQGLRPVPSQLLAPQRSIAQISPRGPRSIPAEAPQVSPEGDAHWRSAA